MKRFFNQLMPFLIIGFAIVAFAFGLMLLAYLLFFGAIIGFILFSILWIRNKFFPTKNGVVKTKKENGRIIDSDDWKEL